MTLEEFVKMEQKNLLAFEKYWRRMADQNPLLFPLKETVGTWSEQFELWCASDR